MPLQQISSIIKRGAVNKFNAVNLSYDYELNEEGKVRQIHATSDATYRVSAWYDPSTDGITIGISDIPKTGFDPAIFSKIATDLLELLKNPNPPVVPPENNNPNP